MNEPDSATTGTATDTPSPDSASALSRDDPRLAEALEEYLAQCRTGRRPDRLAFLARHKEIAPALQDCIEGLAFVQSAAESLPQPSDASDPSAGTPLSPTTILGDFRLIREVGRGGMGIVFEAEQLSLGRRVALKVLPFASALDPRQRQRFQVEAQAAACLHHTHIVPVYAVGNDRGTHYYAMQFIDGRSLSDLIADLRVQADHPLPDTIPAHVASDGADHAEAVAEHSNASATADPDPDQATAAQPLPLAPPAATPTPSGARRQSSNVPPASGSSLTPAGSTSNRSRHFIQGVARLGVQAAGALDHAHQLGIVHRDIKPSNLMLDARGDIWITDFGLARFQDDLGLTRTGDIVGTLRYMSPEQAQARHGIVDQRTDIYSLGATLYELLTLRPAFDARDRAELLRQIIELDPPPVRRHNAAVPRDFETIIGKALAKDPGARYVSAREMADDLDRFLVDKPILARPPTVLERFKKWARRHRAALAAALSMLVVSLVVHSLVLWRSQRETERERAATANALEEVERANARQKSAVQVALQLMDEITYPLMGQAAYAGLLSNDQGRETYLKTVKFFTNVADMLSGAKEPSLRFLAARAERRAGFFRMILRDATADDTYRRAIVGLESLEKDAPRYLPARTELAETLEEFGNWLWMTERPAEAEPNIRQALDLERALLKEQGGRAEQAQRVASAYVRHANRLKQAKRASDAETLVDQVATLARETAQAHPSTSGEMLASLGNTLAQAGYSRQSREVLQALLDAQPESAMACNAVAWPLVARPPAGGKADIERAVALARKAVSLEPDNRPAWNTLGVALWRAGDLDAASDALQKSMSLSDGGDPTDWLVTAAIHAARNQPEDARAEYDRSVAWIQKNRPPDPDFQALRREVAKILGIPEPQRPAPAAVPPPKNESAK